MVRQLLHVRRRDRGNATTPRRAPATNLAAAIRAALVVRLSQAPGPALIVHELRVGSGAYARTDLGPDPALLSDDRAQDENLYVAQANADVALVTPESLDLFEIKSARDSLARLKTQIPAYDDTGSTNTLVVDVRHLERSLEIVPEWWGVIVCSGDPVALEDVRPAAPNPLRSRRGLLEPLYPREVRPFAFAYGAGRDGSKGKNLDYLDAVSADPEVAARWLRYQIAQRDHESVYNCYGGSLRCRSLPASIVGDLSSWPPMTFARSLYPDWQCRGAGEGFIPTGAPAAQISLLAGEEPCR